MSEDDSLLALMEALDPALPPALVADAARVRLRALSAALPFIACVGLECHLNADSPRVDLLAYTGERGVLGSLLAGTPLGRIVTEGGEASMLLERWVDAILFEFDLDDSSRAQTPALFLNFKPGATIDGESLARLAACLVGRLSADASRLLRQCADAAGRDTQVTHLGAMNSRGSKPLRINVGAADAGGLREFVKEVGWDAERRARLDDLLKLAEPLAHHFVLAFDFADVTLPRLGLECYMASAPGYGDYWRRFLARLTEAGLCSEAEAAALLAWPGRTADAAMRGRVSSHARLASFLGAGHTASILRTLNHVKLVSAPGEPTRAKAYLVATRGWHDTAP